MTDPSPPAEEDPKARVGRNRRTRRPPFDGLPEWVAPATRLVHGNRRPDPLAGSVVLPIYQTSTFHYPAAYSESAEHGGVYFYTRLKNPTVEAAAELVRQLEGGEDARLFASGMGAISAVFFSLARPGEEVVALDNLYGGTQDLLRWAGPQFGIPVRWVSDSEARTPERAIGPATRLVFLESPTNPLLRVHDLARWAQRAREFGAVTVVDNTFASPVNQSPLGLGADLVVHSATKYLGGHADLLGGAVVGSERLLERIDPQDTLGAVMDPFAGFLLNRGLRTLALRVERQNRTGREVAEALAGHPKVERVYYPGRGDAEQEAIADRQMCGRGGMVSISVAGGLDAARRFLHRLRLVHIAASLGGVESLASIPGETSHRHLSPAERAARGIPEGLVRLSLGLEDPADLVRDISEALDAA